jgi:hypothetical protein
MDTLISEATGDDGSFAGAPATQTHYYNAAATIFQDTVHPGYEYTNAAGETLDYANVSYYAHNEVGIPEGYRGPDPQEGPCSGCHMTEVDPETGENEYATHNFEIYTKDDDGTITALNSAKCVGCHDGDHGNPGFVTQTTTTEFGEQTAAAALELLNEEAEGYHEALEMFEHVLATELGAFFAPAYPYFFNDTDEDGTLEESEAAYANQFKAWGNEGNNGAAHNFNYLHHEPGAYAHNYTYAKRLIFDSIDWLEDGAIDGTINNYSTDYPVGAAWLGTSRP